MNWAIRSLSFIGFAALCMSISQPAAGADPRDRFEAREFESGGAKLKYRLLTPKGFKAGEEQKYPLVLFLHGAGERGDDNRVQLIHGMGDFASDEVMEKHPAFVVAPQCPKDQRWVDVDWGAESHTMPEQPSQPMRLTLELIESLRKEFPIDENRLYITGLSMGGYGTWDALQRRPELWAAAIPICGGGDPSGAKVMKDIPIWVFHGDQDGAVKVKRSRDMVEALKAEGGNPKYTEYPGVGHDSWTATYRNPEVHAWLFEQSKAKQ
jgi:predicted peptidase